MENIIKTEKIEAETIEARVVTAHTIRAQAVSLINGEGKILTLTYELLNKLANGDKK